MCDSATAFDGVSIRAFSGPRAQERGAALVLKAGIDDEIAASIVNRELADGGEVRRASGRADNANAGSRDLPEQSARTASGGLRIRHDDDPEGIGRACGVDVRDVGGEAEKVTCREDDRLPNGSGFDNTIRDQEVLDDFAARVNRRTERRSGHSHRLLARFRCAEFDRDRSASSESREHPNCDRLRSHAARLRSRTRSR